MTTDATVRLHLLSGFEVVIEGEPAEVQPAGQRLIAFVALAPHGVQRGYAAFQLWPDADERRAQANLRTALWRLGQLPCELLSVTRSKLRLRADVWVDARDGLDEVESSADFGARPFGAMDGDLLPDWYDDWLVVERERLRQHRLRRFEEDGRRALAAGDTAEAIQSGLAALSVDPTRETGSRIVIEGHLAEGNAIEARREYLRFERTIRSRIGMDPSDSLRALVDAG